MNDDVQVLGELLAQADRAADGPSNDDEIDCLRDALDFAVGLIESLGYQVPRRETTETKVLDCGHIDVGLGRCSTYTCPNHVKVGDRVTLAVPMVNDPAPIEMGDVGLVEGVNHLNLGAGDQTQVSVQWDSGRLLHLILPPDHLRVVGAAEEVSGGE